MEYLPILLALLVIGAFAGFLAGLLGVGGGVVLVPAFFYVFHALGYGGPATMQVCLATSLATIIVTSLRSLQSHHKKGAVDWMILRQWFPWIALGALIGVFVAVELSSQVLQIIFGTLGSMIGLWMVFGRMGWTIAEQMPGPVGRGTMGSGIGFLSVLLGIGGGSMAVPMMQAHNVPIHRAVATAAGFGLAISLPSVLGWLWIDLDGPLPPLTFGAVNLPAFGVIVPMTLLMAPVGAATAHRLKPGPLKRIFGAFFLIIAANMLRSAVMI